MSDHDRDEWLTVEDAAVVLRLTPRQVNRYGSGDEPRLRTKRVSRRVLYHRQDVEELADELNVVLKPRVAQPSRAEMVPVGDMLDYIRDRDNQLAQLQGQLNRAAQENGRLSTLVDVQARQLEDAEAARQRLEDAEKRAVAAEAERDQLRTELERRGRGWLRRIFR